MGSTADSWTVGGALSVTGAQTFTGATTLSSLTKLAAAGGAAAANALLMGVGTSGSPATTSTANKNMVEIRSETTATSGDFRNIYLRTAFNGAGVAGESLRANSVVTKAVAGTVNGSHSSVSIGTGGSITGMACGARDNFLIPNSAMSGGTVYGALVEMYAEGASSDVSGTTKHAILGIEANGNSTGKDTVLNAISFVGGDGSGKMIYTNTSTPGDSAGSIRILVGGTARYLRFWSAEA